MQWEWKHKARYQRELCLLLFTSGDRRGPSNGRAEATIASLRISVTVALAAEALESGDAKHTAILYGAAEGEAEGQTETPPNPPTSLGSRIVRTKVAHQTVPHDFRCGRIYGASRGIANWRVSRDLGLDWKQPLAHWERGRKRACVGCRAPAVPRGEGYRLPRVTVRFLQTCRCMQP